MGVPILQIAGALFAGRILKYAIFGYLASHAPRYLMKVKFIRKEIEEAQALQALKDAKKAALDSMNPKATSTAPADVDQAAR